MEYISLEVNNKKVNLATFMTNNIKINFIPDISIELTENNLFLLHVNFKLSKNYILSSIYSTDSLLFKFNSHVVKCMYMTPIKIISIHSINSIYYIYISTGNLLFLQFQNKKISDPISNIYGNHAEFKKKRLKKTNKIDEKHINDFNTNINDKLPGIRKKNIKYYENILIYWFYISLVLYYHAKILTFY